MITCFISFRRGFAAAVLAALLASIGATALPTAAAGCGATDADGDGLTCYDEYTFYGTDPETFDTDGDGVNDGLEIYYGSNPLVADANVYPDRGVQQLLDSDGDGLWDVDERGFYGTNPVVVDTDGDSIGDGEEVYYGSNPMAYDTDGDGVDDGSELRLGWNPLDPSSRPASKG